MENKEDEINNLKHCHVKKQQAFKYLSFNVVYIFVKVILIRAPIEMCLI